MKTKSLLKTEIKKLLGRKGGGGGAKEKPSNIVMRGNEKICLHMFTFRKEKDKTSIP